MEGAVRKPLGKLGYKHHLLHHLYQPWRVSCFLGGHEVNEQPEFLKVLQKLDGGDYDNIYRSPPKRS